MSDNAQQNGLSIAHESVPVISHGNIIAEEAHMLLAPVAVTDDTFADGCHPLQRERGYFVDPFGTQRRPLEVEDLPVRFGPEFTLPWLK